MQHSIEIIGAKEHNLKNISLRIPKNKLVLLTGPSGSGKSTLALDTLQRECQRQYMESMGMTTDAISKPKVDSIIGLSPSISIGQHITNRNPRSTVGTATDMYTYLRVLFEKIGVQVCPLCHEKVSQIIDKEGDTNHEDGFKQFIQCPSCEQPFEKLTRSHFSFNKPEGACDTCDGLGTIAELQYDAVFQEDLSLNEGSVTIWKGQFLEYQINVLKAAANYYQLELDLTMPLKNFSPVLKDLLFFGVESEVFQAHFSDKLPPKTVGQGKFEGVVTGIWRRYKEKGGQSGEATMFFKKECPDCAGQKLKKASREVSINNTSITTLTARSLEEFQQWLENLEHAIPSETLEAVNPFIVDLKTKISRLMKVGLGYLSLDRQTITLSGGEAQRLRLATILGSGLTGVLYILDEPTAGLHPKDTLGLLQIMKELRDIGNTVLVIEHDMEMMKGADHIIDIGPGAGKFGGTVVGEGTVNELMKQKDSITGAYLNNLSTSGLKRRHGIGEQITVHHARKHNLKNLTVSFPLGCLISVTGVSGSGKSTLVFDVLDSEKNTAEEAFGTVTGLNHVENIVTVNQSPLTRMQRSNIATYTDAFTFIRNVFASLPAAKEKELKPKDFSFNTQGGRCEHCQGLGFVLTNMHFLPDLEVKCPVCKGKRFKDSILEITYHEKSISEILDLTIEESQSIFQDVKKLAPIINLLCEVGLGYLSWGQSVTTLSGGEGQRLKLAKELYKQSTGHTLYLLDEPTTGLHPTDINKLLNLLQRLVDAGNTVIVVEHTIEMIRASDWVIDMGPDGGDKGGTVIACGTPEEIEKVADSYTGSFLQN